jgi:hypothetical protein
MSEDKVHYILNPSIVEFHFSNCVILSINTYVSTYTAGAWLSLLSYGIFLHQINHSCNLSRRKFDNWNIAQLKIYILKHINKNMLTWF